MTDQTAHAILHWFWAAFFAGFGVYLLFRPGCMMSASCRVLRLSDASDRERVDAALERRREIERIASTTGYGAAAFSFVMAVLSAVSHVSTGLLYAIFCLGLGSTMTIFYLQLRNSQPKRVAVLSARTSGAVIPPWAFALAGVNAAACIALVTLPQLTVAASVVFVSTALTIYAAWRLTSLPSLLQGIDVPVETTIDERLRFQRSASVLILGIAQPFVFASQTLDDRFQLIWIVYFVTLVPFFVFGAWAARKMFAKVSFAGRGHG